MKKLTLILFLLACNTLAIAQGEPQTLDSERKLFESQEFLPQDIRLALQRARVTDAEELAQLTDSIWNSTALVPSQKETLYSITRNMESEGYSTALFLRDFYGAIGYGVRHNKFPEGQFDQFLSIVRQMLDENAPDRQTIRKFLKTARAYMQLGVLYKSREYQLKVENSSISFEYIFDDENEPIVEPYDPQESLTQESPTSGGIDWFDNSSDPWGGDDSSSEEETTWDSEEANPWDEPEQEETNDTSTDDGWGSSDDGWSDSGWGDTNDDWGDGDWENQDGYSDWGQNWDDAEDTGGPVEQVSIDSVEVPNIQLESCAASDTLPKRAGYFINIDTGSIVFETRFDTVRIDNIKAYLLPKTEEFVTMEGHGGRFNWTAPGVNPDSVYCDLGRYSFNLRRPRFRAEGAKMHNAARLDSTVVGLLVWDNHLYNNHPTKAVFPKFQSYNNDIEVTNFAENVTYFGGFSMIGNRMNSESCNQGPSTIELIIDGERKFRAVSGSGFYFKGDRIESPKSKVWIYYQVGEDTTNHYIHHAAVGLKYHIEPQKVIRMKKNMKGYRDFPFESTYHGVEITGDYVEWDLESDSINFSILQSKDVIPLVVESKSYFDPYRYANLQGVYRFHPLKLLVGYARHRYTKQKKKGAISITELSQFSNQSPRVIDGAMRFLASLNFVDYYITDPSDPVNSAYVNIKPKTVHYVLSNENMVQAQLSREDESRGGFKRNKHDFDMYDIRSRNAERSGANAVISIKDSARLNMKGVTSFVISDTMKVKVAPKDGQLALGQNRDTYFNGTVQVDTTIFEGSSMQLDYRNYILHMDSIKSIHFLVLDSATGQRVPTPNGIQNTSGAFHIANRNNKSGMVKTEVDPIDHRSPEGTGNLTGKFIAGGDGFIYFDGEEIRGHESYTKDRFFFKLDSGFELNKVMPGHFNSSIFPEFTEAIGSMPDGALGFRHGTTSDAEEQYRTNGYPLYTFEEDNPNRFRGSIVLNNDGLMGGGILNYLAGEFESEEFVFYPDSVITDTRGSLWKGTRGMIASGTYERTGASYPVVEMEDFNLRWLVPQDSLLLTSRTADKKKYQEAMPFDIYNVDSTVFSGTLTLTPSDLLGRGKLESISYVNQSDNYDFNEKDYLSRNSNFIIKSSNPEKPSVAANDVKIEYNYAESLANFTSEDVTNDAFSFPFVEYQTDIQEALWDFSSTSNKLTMSANVAGEPATFISRNRYQEDLEFDGTDAIYDINQDTLTVRGVKSIPVANVSIIPNEGVVTVRKEAQMDSLENAVIVMNRFSKYHKVTEATVGVISRSKFAGHGIYTYVNDGGEEYRIDLTIGDRDIVSISDNPSVAENKNRKKKEEGEQYKNVQGGFRITARGKISDEEKFIIQPGIQYGGQVEVQDHIPYPLFNGTAKLAINREDNSWFKFQNSDTTEVVITVDDVEDGYSTAKLQTGLYLSQFKQVYAPFIQFKREWGGGQPLLKGEGELRFRPEKNAYEAAPTTKLDGETMKGNRVFYSFAEDSVGFDGEIKFLNPNENYTFKASAVGGMHLQKDNLEFKSTIVLDFKAGGPLEKALKEGLEVDAYQDIIKYPSKKRTQRLMSPFVSEKDLQKIENNQRVSDFYKEGIVMSDVIFKWSPQYKAFYSVGGVIGVSSVFKEEIESFVEGVIEIPMGNNRHTAHVLLKNRNGKKFYFGISKDNIKTFADNSDYMEALKKEKGPLKEAKTPATGGQDREIADFFNRARIYAGGLSDLQIPDAPDEGGNLDDKPIEDNGNGNNK